MQLETTVVTISPDSPDDLRRYAEKHDLGFVMLSDPELETGVSYGIINPQNKSVPHPTAVIVDRLGVIRFVRIDEDFKKRPTPAELLAAIKGLGP